MGSAKLRISLVRKFLRVQLVEVAFSLSLPPALGPYACSTWLPVLSWEKEKG